ncbi:MAG: hypothetical protein IPF82_16120 [Blastocatellia bacterium]|nr:hypothetical protein [Blastocatellia bacterium]
MPGISDIDVAVGFHGNLVDTETRGERIASISERSIKFARAGKRLDSTRARVDSPDRGLLACVKVRWLCEIDEPRRINCHATALDVGFCRCAAVPVVTALSRAGNGPDDPTRVDMTNTGAARSRDEETATRIGGDPLQTGKPGLGRRTSVTVVSIGTRPCNGASHRIVGTPPQDVWPRNHVEFAGGCHRGPTVEGTACWKVAWYEF